MSKIFVVPTHYFRYDVVDWTRQLMANLAHKFHSNVVDAFLKKDGKAFDEHRAKFELLLGDMGIKLMHLVMISKAITDMLPFQDKFPIRKCSYKLPCRCNNLISGRAAFHRLEVHVGALVGNGKGSGDK